MVRYVVKEKENLVFCLYLPVADEGEWFCWLREDGEERKGRVGGDVRGRNGDVVNIRSTANDDGDIM